MNSQIWPLDAATYTRNMLHGEDRAWTETNCYVDLWIELLHAQQLDPVAGLAFTLAMDFEGDQWTFFKQPLGDIYEMYGLDVQELTIWKSLLDHTVEQVSRGRAVLVEVDSFFLPDTAGVAYKIAHAKTTIAIQQIDAERRTLGYFHNASYYTLSGDDFDGVFKRGAYTVSTEALPPYAEFVKLDGRRVLDDDALKTIVITQTRRHLQRRPAVNPVQRYRIQFERDLEWLKGEDISVFHLYAFATLRQCGACAELAATFIAWLEAHGETGLEEARTGFETMSTTAKSLQFKVARAVVTKKPFDPAPMFDAMENGWELAMQTLISRYDA